MPADAANILAPTPGTLLKSESLPVKYIVPKSTSPTIVVSVPCSANCPPPVVASSAAPPLMCKS